MNKKTALKSIFVMTLSLSYSLACSPSKSTEAKTSTESSAADPKAGNDSSVDVMAVGIKLLSYDPDAEDSYFPETLIFVDGKPINAEGPNAGGYSESRFIFNEGDGPDTEEESYKNFSAALLASSCPFKHGDFSSLSYKDSQEVLLGKIACLGKITSKKTSFGEE